MRDQEGADRGIEAQSMAVRKFDNNKGVPGSTRLLSDGGTDNLCHRPGDDAARTEEHRSQAAEPGHQKVGDGASTLRNRNEFLRGTSMLGLADGGCASYIG